MLWSPATYSVFAAGVDVGGVGVGEALGDADGDAEDFGDVEGLGEVSSRAPETCPVPPDLLVEGDALGDALDECFGLDDGDDELFGDNVGVGVGVSVGVGVDVGTDVADCGSPVPAGLEPGEQPTLLGIAVVHSSTCRNRSSAAVSSGAIWLALAPGIEMLMSCAPCCWTVVLLMPRPLNRLSRIEIAVFMSVLVGTPPFAATALSVTSVPPCRSRPSPTLNFLCQSPGCRAAPLMTAASMTNHDVHVRLMHGIGIVQGMDDEKSTFKGKDTSGTYTWMDVFEMRDGKWQAVASQVTKVK